MDLIVLFLCGTFGMAALAYCLYSLLMGMSKEPLENFGDKLNYLTTAERGDMNEQLNFKLRIAAHGSALLTIVFAVGALHNIIHYLF
ncbi:hypothetical protein DBR37_14805 [Herminiimonas sp. KBW02]|uniref:hypothetical protein n=1 Tax=Herminiimonas sp. KBW02 TaxID=2153363 RepID=UPI000F5A233E|nr:hypothetical protein [Herminiimonas sp. KBW02]RQO33466.1 hypothetical protein DBR37_14805 [Herminiimonas sp. KBW02]